MNYKDMTFCDFYEDCEHAKTCNKPLTEEVKKAAKEWWGNDQAPISHFLDKPSCHKLKTKK